MGLGRATPGICASSPPQFTVAPTCSTKPIDEIVNRRRRQILLAFAVVLKLSRLSKSIGDPELLSVPAVRAERVRGRRGRKVIRTAICILKAFLFRATDDADSVQIIIPQNQVKQEAARYGVRSFFLKTGLIGSFYDCASDIYNRQGLLNAQCLRERTYMSSSSAQIVETDRPEQEILPGLSQLLGPIYEKYEIAFISESCPLQFAS